MISASKLVASNIVKFHDLPHFIDEIIYTGVVLWLSKNVVAEGNPLRDNYGLMQICFERVLSFSSPN